MRALTESQADGIAAVGPERTGAGLKVCFLSSMHGARDKRVFEKEALSLSAAGFRVSHICPGNAEDAGSAGGVQVKPYPRHEGLRGRLRQMIRLFRLARAENADVLHCNEVDSWAIGVAVRLLHGGKCVFDVHEHYPSTFATSRFPPPLRPVIEAMVRLSFRLLTPFTDRIVLAKQSVGDDFHCPADRKVLVRNFARLAATNRVGGDRAHRRADEPLRIAHLGLFNRWRGWPQVLDAMAAAKADLRLEVIGTINDGSAAEFRNRVAELGLTSRVTMHDWMPFDAAFQHLLRGHVGLIAFQPHIQNHVYAMPHKLFDYMAAGMAVLLPKQAIEVAPIVEETGCGLLIDPADPSQLASALDWMAENPEATHQMGERGKAAIRREHNWEAEAAKLIGMYRQLGARG